MPQDDKEKDIKIKSLATGKCLKCEGELTCQKGCYNPNSYIGDTESNIALQNGVCQNCGEKVDCPSGHLSDRIPGESKRRFDEPYWW